MSSETAQVLEIKRTCKKCGIERDLSDFWKEKSSLNGHRPVCKTCSSARRKLKIKRRIFNTAKNCLKCGIEKSLEEFPKHKGCTIDGHLNQCSVCKNKYQSDYGYKNRERRKPYQRIHSRKWVLRTKYNLSLDAYFALFERQNGKCAICLSDIERMSHHTHVDHCHITGKVRGILCRHCNRGLGAFQDNEASLRNAINYLLQSRMV